MSEHTIMRMTFVYVVVILSSQKKAFYVDAAPSVSTNELDVNVLPSSVAELVDSDAFQQIWRDAAADQMARRFGRDGQLPTRNMVGDYIVSDEFHQAVCKGGGQGMASMGGMMGNAPPPWSYMGTFIGSEKFQHGACDMMSQGMIQFGDAMNGWFRSGGVAEAAEPQDPVQAVDGFFRSEHYRNARAELRKMYSDVRF